MAVNLRGLIAKLNAPTRSAVEAAAGLCLSRTNYDVEIEHFLVKVLDHNDGDLAAILKHFGINRSRLADDLARALDRIKTGNARTPSLSPSLVSMLSEGWLLGSVEFGAPRVRTGHALLALNGADEPFGAGFVQSGLQVLGQTLRIRLKRFANLDIEDAGTGLLGAIAAFVARHHLLRL